MRASRILPLLLAVAVLAAAGVALRGYVTDDTFIHLRYAENLLHRGEFAFNPGEHSYGATSPLWIFGLALLLALGTPAMAAPFVLGALSGLLAVIIAWDLTGRLGLGGRWRAVVMLLIACDAWFLRWSFSGMETPLATALLLALLAPLLRDGGLAAGDRPRHVAWGVAAGLAALVRPEYMLVVPPAWLWLAWAADRGHRWRVRIPDALAAAAGWLLVVGPWLAFAWWSFGRITPGTAAAKSAAVSLAPGVVIPYLVQAAQVPAATQGLLWLGALIIAVLAWRAWRGPAGKDRRPDRREIALVGVAVTWSVLLMGGYAVKQVWIISRYICPLSPVLILAAVVIVRRVLCVLGAGNPRGRTLAVSVLAVCAAATLLVNGWIFTRQVMPHARLFPLGVRECYLGMGEWLRGNTPPDAVIAALDIGAVGYASERRVLDLMGLVSPEVLAVGQDMGFQDMVTSGAWLDIPAHPDGGPPDYFIDRSEGAPRWAGRTVHGVRFELLDTCEIRGVGLREPQTWTVALYRLWGPPSRTRPSAGG